MKTQCNLWLLLSLLAASIPTQAQTSASTDAVANPVPHTTVPFRISDAGTKLPDIKWGLDLAWISESNLRRGVQFAGQDMIEIVRLSFQTTNSVANGALSDSQKSVLDRRIGYVKKWAPNAVINLNSDQDAGVDSWYGSSRGTRWSQLIKLTKEYVEKKGLTVASVSPFNEPDYTAWEQGTKADFLNICRTLRADETFNNVLLCGGNTLNDDEAAGWYNYCKSALDMGNTHQLAGSFDNFASFYAQVAADGKIGMADELHNTMEAMIASNYGLGQAIWWGTCEHTRSQWMKASRGTRLGYAENRSRWTAASVYRHPSTDVHPGGYVQGFGGTSERQATPTTFRFAALDHDVFYDGYGPTREYNMDLPGGTGYRQGQKNAEGLVNIQDGEDIMPLIADGSYRVVNRFSGYYLAPGSDLSRNPGLVQVKTPGKTASWNLRRVARDRGGDFSYITIRNASDTTYVPDLLNWTLEDQGEVICYRGGLGDNEIWYLEYASDGYYYIKSKHSGYCLDLKALSDTQRKSINCPVVQAPCTGAQTQQWRLIDATAAFNSVAPQAPAGLRATPQAASIRLDWQTSKTERDIKDFIILRSSDQQTWNTIYQLPAPKVVTADSAFAYIDNTALPNTTYFYKVRMRDLSLNRSAESETVSAVATGEASCIARFGFEGTLSDESENGNHAATLINPAYSSVQFKEGSNGLQLTTSQYLQLPATIAASEELTICAWVRWGGGQTWARIFDFGTDPDHYFFVTPQCGSGPRFAIKNGGSEQYVSLGSSFPVNTWTHVAVTFGADAIRVYLNGRQAAASTSITTRPRDFMPIFNFIGRSQFRDDPLLNGYVDDLRIYNYALSADDISSIADHTDAVTSVHAQPSASTLYDLNGRRVQGGTRGSRSVLITDGRKVLR